MTLSERTFSELLDALGDRTPAPGGGAVAPLVAALAAALGRMVLAYSIDKKSLQAFQEDNTRALEQLGELETEATRCAADDATAYTALSELLKLPADDPRRQAELLAAVEEAIAPPRRTIELCERLLELIEQLVDTTNRWLASDLAVAAVLAGSAGRAAAWNIRANLEQLQDTEQADSQRGDLDDWINRLDAQSRDLEARITT